MLKKDLTVDSAPLNLTIDKFDFGLRIAYVPEVLEPLIGQNLDEYIDLTVYQTYYFWTSDNLGNPVFNKTKNRIPLVPCGDNRLGMTPNS